MEFTILLSRSSKYWSYRHGPLCLVLTIPAILCDLNLNSPDNSNTEEFFKDFLAKEIFFIFFFFCILVCVLAKLHVCMCGEYISEYLRCICVCACLCPCTCVHAQRIKLDLGSLPWSLFALFLEAGSLSWSQSSLIWLTSPLCLLSAEVQVSQPIQLTFMWFWGSELSSSCPHSKCF